MSDNQQIIISGLGGQGVLFITKLLAEAAMAGNHRVLTSETHGMAQRGGNVISYVKIGDFSGPLIRPGKANGLIALKEESFFHHKSFLKSDGFGVVNSVSDPKSHGFRVYSGDADRLAQEADSPRSVNLVMLGFFTAVMEKRSGILSMDSLTRVIRGRFTGKQKISDGIIHLLEVGYNLIEKGKS